MAVFLDHIKNPQGVGMFNQIRGTEVSDGIRYVTEKIGDLIIGLTTLLVDWQ